MFKSIGIIGLGLIGGSIAKDVKRLKLAESVCGYDIDVESVNKALNLGVIDRACDIEGIKRCDFIIVAVPVGAFDAVFEALGGCERIVADVGSVKSKAIENAKKNNLKRFVAVHPIAGTENFGIEAAVEGLFEDAFCVMTPFEGCDDEAFKKTSLFFKRLGMRIVEMDADEHDRVFAFVSHMPHAVAYALVDLATKKGERFKFIGGGFRDFTRIAASNEKMWSDIFLLNRRNVIDAIDEFIESLNSLKALIDRSDEKRLKEKLKRIREAKMELYG